MREAHTHTGAKRATAHSPISSSRPVQSHPIPPIPSIQLISLQPINRSTSSSCFQHKKNSDTHKQRGRTTPSPSPAASAVTHKRGQQPQVNDHPLHADWTTGWTEARPPHPKHPNTLLRPCCSWGAIWAGMISTHPSHTSTRACCCRSLARHDGSPQRAAQPKSDGGTSVGWDSPTFRCALPWPVGWMGTYVQARSNDWLCVCPPCMCRSVDYSNRSRRSRISRLRKHALAYAHDRGHGQQQDRGRSTGTRRPHCGCASTFPPTASQSQSREGERDE